MARMGQSPAPKAWDGVLRHQHQQYPGSGELKAESLSLSIVSHYFLSIF